VALLVVLAGCSVPGLEGGGPRLDTTVTPVEVVSESGPFALPLNRSAVAAVHRARLREAGTFRVRIHLLRPRGGDGFVTVTRVARVNLTTGAVLVEIDRTYSVARRAVSTVYVPPEGPALRRSPDGSVERVEGEPPNARALAFAIPPGPLSGLDFAYDPRGGGGYTYRASGPGAILTPGAVPYYSRRAIADLEAALVLTDRERVRSFELRVDPLPRSNPSGTRLRVTYDRVGTATVPEPGWYGAGLSGNASSSDDRPGPDRAQGINRHSPDAGT
jgi:hypothetical protein